jgi:hypothetical protein
MSSASTTEEEIARMKRTSSQREFHTVSNVLETTLTLSWPQNLSLHSSPSFMQKKLT